MAPSFAGPCMCSLCPEHSWDGALHPANTPCLRTKVTKDCCSAEATLLLPPALLTPGGTHFRVTPAVSVPVADSEGFIAIDEFLRCQGGPHDVFAVGDVASSAVDPRPKAGVFAVRQGPVLAENLRRYGIVELV